MFEKAFKEKQFSIYYQAQFNHSTGLIVGAEALARWIHPEKGLVPPQDFIPLMEENGEISLLDLYVFEEVCIFLRKCIDEGTHVVPVSVNISRHDIKISGFADKLEAVRKKYDIPVNFLRLEITETASEYGAELLASFLEDVHKAGYKVEMDDFGTGYSSLNVLKDIDFDILKLDMGFVRGNLFNGKGGIILSSVIRMAKWLGMPIIAEGVEDKKQADFLLSIGCECIQGFYYSRPVPEQDYVQLVNSSTIGQIKPAMSLINTMDAQAFWSPESLETLIFNNYVGGACIFEYHEGSIEVLRVNEKYLKELGMNMSEKDLISTDLLSMFDDDNRQIYLNMLKKAIESDAEAECECWGTVKSECCGEEKLCVRSSVRVIGRGKNSYMFYAMIRNITSEKNRYNAILDSEKRFKMASEQVNIYYWEYTVATREMRPCFRCMRDLGLPALVRNYPEPAIEMGIFPPEVADMYRDWHRQIAEGVPSLEAVMPLTVGRVPFLVRYTTEFDDAGNPVKAYGSAALVVDNT